MKEEQEQEESMEKKGVDVEFSFHTEGEDDKAPSAPEDAEFPPLPSSPPLPPSDDSPTPTQPTTDEDVEIDVEETTEHVKFAEDTNENDIEMNLKPEALYITHTSSSDDNSDGSSDDDDDDDEANESEMVFF
eukprot:m.151898 g.151898  ORF g.151898 m.151898 type:complete len:132 (+) comp13295_c3_seq1:2726-3121(+)